MPAARLTRAQVCHLNALFARLNALRRLHPVPGQRVKALAASIEGQIRLLGAEPDPSPWPDPPRPRRAPRRKPATVAPIGAA